MCTLAALSLCVLMLECVCVCKCVCVCICVCVSVCVIHILHMQNIVYFSSRNELCVSKGKNASAFLPINGPLLNMQFTALLITSGLLVSLSVTDLILKNK